jgi:predicted nuclease of restriction endonuclease-like (RecB) superfamily
LLRKNKEHTLPQNLIKMPKNQTLLKAEFDAAAYGQLVADAKERVHSGQLSAWRAVNKELINLYWDLGKLIVERQQEHGWGNSVVEMLAKDLQAAFPRMRGLSASNLWRARAFYLIYQDDEILAPITREIGWTHNYTIFEKCKDTNERHFYLLMTKRFGWTINVLIHQIENQTFEKPSSDKRILRKNCLKT